MRLRGLRTWAKWACTSAAIAVVAGAVGSTWINVTWVSSDGTMTVELGTGWIILEMHEYPVPFRGLAVGLFDKPDYRFGYIHMAALPAWFVPVWPLVLISAASAGVLWWTDRGSPSHQCKTCNYDRRGLAADCKCPECGTIPTSGSVRCGGG